MGVFWTVRTTKTSGMAPLQCRVQSTNPKVNFALATKISAEIKYFSGDGKEGRLLKYYKTDEGKILKDKLERIEAGINYYLDNGKAVTKEQAKKVIDSIVFEKEIKEKKEAALKRKLAKAEKTKMTFAKYREQYLKDIINGARATYKGTNFSAGTIESYTHCIDRLKKFDEYMHHQYDFMEIDMTYYRDFVAYLKQEDYGINSIGKTIKVIKTLMACADEDGYEVNQAYLKKNFKAPSFDADSIYLTKEDLDAIRKVDLSGLNKSYTHARDMFFVGLWTAQRVSDYLDIKKEDIQEAEVIQTDANGQKVKKTIMTVAVVQKKTGKKVVIPCSSELVSIIKKYDGNLPKIDEQYINIYMKKIGEKAGLVEQIDIRSTKGGSLSSKKMAKHQLIQTHTARRTGATLMYLSGMSVFDICKITGHSNIKTLERYIKADELETVKKITDAYDYFD